MRGNQRGKKINLKSSLRIIHECDLAEQDADDVSATDALSSLPKVESGVDTKEEKEHHLQAAINASRAAAFGGKAAGGAIPTPEVGVADISYERLYPTVFKQPATYIRYSSTVEDCIGVPYCMSEEDEIVLKQINAKHQALPGQPQQCTEDWFEQVMNAFEETSAVRQPFSAVDHPPVLPLEEMEMAFDETVDDGARLFAKEVYEYWKAERLKRGNRGLVPKLKTLKMDTAQEADDSDPYICFRRREVRQVRKTRGRDAQVVEKLKKLRRELEDGRHLLDLVKQREVGRQEDLALSRQMFEQRATVREMKRSLGIEDKEDTLLINQRAKPPTGVPPSQLTPGTSVRLPGPRPDAPTAPENDLVDLRALFARREKEISSQIENSMAAHDNWNRGFVDLTEAAIHGFVNSDDVFALPSNLRAISQFASMKLEITQQPTPPDSVVADSASEGGESIAAQSPIGHETNVRLATPAQAKGFKDAPRFRVRKGRGGRQVIDRHNFKLRKNENSSERDYGRFKFDHDEGDIEDELSVDLDGTTDFYPMKNTWSTRDAAVAGQAVQRRASSVSQRDIPMVNGAPTAGGLRN